MNDTIPVPIGDYNLSDVINKTQPNGVINVPIGVFPIRCDGTVTIQSGVRITGESKTGTIIQRDPNSLYAVNNQPVLFGQGDNITLENFTWDANSPDNPSVNVPASNYAYMGIRIKGKSPRIVNVNGIRPTGNFKLGQEGWSIFLITGEDIPTGVVRDCSVSDVRGDYIDGFSSSGACVFENNVVNFPVLSVSDQPPIFNGYQGSRGSIFKNCRQVGGTNFFYTDTESSKNMRIEGCYGTQLLAGIIVRVAANEVCDSLSVDNCLFEIQPGLVVNYYGVAASGPGKVINLRSNNCIVTSL